MTESESTRRFCQEMVKLNAVVFSIVGSNMQSPGWPDRYIAHRRWAGWIEFKGPRTRLAHLQALRIRALRERGVNAVIVRFPNRIEDENGELLGVFDGSARHFLETCPEVSK